MLLGRHFRILQGFRISEETRPSLSQTGAGFLLKLHMSVVSPIGRRPVKILEGALRTWPC